jgi:predicted metal-dependent phosphoesterase TrpH
MIQADLHTHSNRSDGLLAPAELARQARAAGVECLALTDHDSVAGVAAAAAAGQALGVQVIPGVELSARDVDPHTGERSEDHLLGFFVDPSAPSLLGYLAGLQEARVAMAHETLAALARLGVPVDPARVAQLAEGAVITRPHIARALVEAGHVASEREAFDRFLGTGRPAAPERPAPGPATAIAVVRTAGGAAGLAHPVFAREPDWAERLARLPARLERLRAEGLMAVECFYPDATPAITDQLLAWTRERGLIATGGSDYHGPGKAPCAPLGHCAVGGEVVEALRAARG